VTLHGNGRSATSKVIRTGLGYNFIRDDHGTATDVVEMHVSGDYQLHRKK
jgi:hypothetical protein